MQSGFDWYYFEQTRSSALFSFALPAAILGFFLPIVLPVALYLVGEWRKNMRMQNTAAAVAQAGALGWIISSLYKVFTGREQPYFNLYYQHTPTLDTSHQFNFGFLQHGVFWGWPSSHATVALAGMVALTLLYSEKKILRTLVLLYLVYVIFGVSISIHWFSDTLAGTIIGTLVGVTVAKSFLKAKKN